MTAYVWKFKANDMVEINDCGRKYKRVLLHHVNDCGGWRVDKPVPEPNGMRLWNEDCMQLASQAADKDRETPMDKLPDEMIFIFFTRIKREFTVATKENKDAKLKAIENAGATDIKVEIATPLGA